MIMACAVTETRIDGVMQLSVQDVDTHFSYFNCLQKLDNMPEMQVMPGKLLFADPHCATHSKINANK